jgi:hypothetical protein
MSNQESWYCRAQGEIFGPLTLVQMLHYIILKKVGADDEVSNDAQSWQPLKLVKSLNPQAVMGLKVLLSDEEMAYLESTQAWSAKNIVTTVEEDRADEEYSEIRRRRAQRKNPLVGYLVVVALIALVVGITFIVPKGAIQIVADCSSAPVPMVNWSNCSFEKAVFSNRDLNNAKLRNIFMSGVNLQASNLSQADIAYGNLSLANLKGARFDGADMRGTNLRKADLRRASLLGADLSFADLTGANLTGADLEGANFSSTIWTDGKICAQDSIGSCSKNF